MEPRVTKRDRKLHLSYELPHRVHCTQVYPVKATNGSTLIIYGHDRGFRILWRGGGVPRRQQTAKADGGASTDVILIDDSDDEAQGQKSEQEPEETQYEEEERDPDCPYPSIIAEVDVDLDSAVLQLATPSLAPSVEQASSLFTKHAPVALTGSDGSAMIISIPLEAPTDDFVRELPQRIIETRVDLPQASLTYRSIAVHAHTTRDDYSSESLGVELVVAAMSDTLRIFRLPIIGDELSQELDDGITEHRLGCVGKTVNFHPSSHSSQILITDVSGAARIFDPAAPNTSQRPSSRDSALMEQASNQSLGRWIVAFNTAYASDVVSLPRRKQILDATWVLSGRAILVVLEDGEWGIWDVSGSLQKGKSIREFVLKGYLGSTATETSQLAQQKKGSSKLAPMTPNTRKAKAENLFTGPPKVAGVAPSGSISTTQSITRAGQTDESVMITYGSDIYSIPSVQTFWQRSTSSSSAGSLYSSGLTHLTDINLMNENVTSTAQFASNSSSANLGQMNTQRDIIISAEHRLIILQHLRPQTPSKALFQKAAEQPAARDQRMLDAGELDIGGMDRMLDSLANGEGRTRRVGFAH